MKITLKGCTAEPLGSYLKGLAVLRLIGTQKEPDIKGWWEDGVFSVESSLNQDAIVEFFMNEYRPTPIVAPWRGGGGFYEGDNKIGLRGILGTTSSRFENYRRTIEEIMLWPEIPSEQKIEHMLSTFKAIAEEKGGKSQESMSALLKETKKSLGGLESMPAAKDYLTMTMEDLKASGVDASGRSAIKGALSHLKKVRTSINQVRRSSSGNAIIQKCRNRLSGEVIEWLDAAVIVGEDSKAKPNCPRILGTGGNEGRLDYTNTFMSHVYDLLISPDDSSESKGLLRNALFDEFTDRYSISSAGQYDPGRAGGYNQGYGIEQKDFPTNPWNFVLTLEGTVLWASGIGRRHGVESRGVLRSPFTAHATVAGYGSSQNDSKDAARAEIWVPLWRNPLGIKELKAFLSEGRAEVGRRIAANGIQFAEAASSFGVDRGVGDFVRYSLLKRRGDSYVALPTGVFHVGLRKETDLIRELETILMRLDAFLRKMQSMPSEFSSARRQIDEMMFEVLLRGGSVRMKRLVMAIGKMEKLLAIRDITKEPILKSPMVGLSPRWLVAADDGSIEYRVAAALASLRPTGKVGPIRANLAPVDPRRPYAWVSNDMQMAWAGKDFSARLSGLLIRRMMDAERLNCDTNPLRTELRLRTEDIAYFMERPIDDAMIEDLLFGLMWVNMDRREATGKACGVLAGRWRQPILQQPIRRDWALLKLLFLPHDVRRGGKEVRIKPEPSVVPLLRAGRIGDACKIASRRLYSCGLPSISSSFQDGAEGGRIAAALLLPVSNEMNLMDMALGREER